MNQVHSFLLGTSIFAVLLLVGLTVAQSPKRSAPSPGPRKWMIAEVDMGHYTESSDGGMMGTTVIWEENGRRDYQAAQQKLLDGGWEPFAANTYRGDFNNTNVVWFRKLK